MARCKIAGCRRSVFAKGWCSTHYQRWRHHGDPNYNPRAKYEGTCNVEGCNAAKFQKGFCRPHYMRWYRHGDPLAGNAPRADKAVGPTGCGAVRCPAAARLRGQLHYAKNKKDYVDRAVAQPPEQKRKARQKWKKVNPGKVAVHSRRRKANMKAATPSWLTEEHWAQINSLYDEAKALTEATGEEYHVDHVIPLMGRYVCGLHVPWNLQVLRGTENLTKPRVYKES